MLSVVVATHNDPRGLYLTIYALLQQLQDSSWKWELIIAADGGTEYKWEKIPNVRCLRIRTGSPQGTRDAGIRAAKYPIVLCVESHVIVNNILDWFDTHRTLGATLSFSQRVGETAELYNSFGYRMDWDGSFWFKSTIYQTKDAVSYPIVGFGHACFMVDRDFYTTHGGYFLEMRGWGGEEPDLNLLVWHMGGSVWMIPRIMHAHHLLPGAHAERTADFARNFCIAAYEHGGHEYLQKVENHFGYKLQRNAAIEERRRYICTGKFGGDLNKLRDYFKVLKILSSEKL